ncbi:syntaxin-12 [Dendroctonus ponderosae]|uniref:t-SNARE coiled-coil homology domain-containing protein n=1 Tax=Dendroctonus ponderosae TaxID=77166 RepID=J3JYY6_DENPD
MNRQTTNYGSIRDPEVGFSGSTNNDVSREFNDLFDNIATNLYTINSSIRTLLDSIKLIGTAKDNAGLRNKLHVTQMSTNQVVAATSRDIVKLSKKLPRSDKSRVLQLDKLESDFKSTINKYHILQKEVADKQKSNLLLLATVEHTPPDEVEDESEQKQIQRTRETKHEQDMLLERAERVKRIEDDILDINEIMRELAFHVEQQADTIETIENSIDHAVGNVTEGAEQVRKASQYQTRYRKKLIIFVIIAVLIAIILIAILATTLKK